MRAVIFANGNLNQPENPRAALRPDDYLIAADGGYHHYRVLGLIPHALIGDLDSITAEEKESLSSAETRVFVHPRDKDETDLELALKHAVDMDVEEILLLGALGGRMDQTLANLLLLTRPEWQTARLTIADGLDFATLMRMGDRITLQTQRDDTVSLIPLSSRVTGATTQGLRWSLINAILEFGSTLGISNEAIGETARVEIGGGQLLVVHRMAETSTHVNIETRKHENT